MTLRVIQPGRGMEGRGMANECNGNCCRKLDVPTHPVQTKHVIHKSARCPQVVTRRAYEVYCEVFAPQEALVNGDCRGGFSAGELIAFLYAYPFPESEWRKRVDEALHGMTQL